MSRNGTGEIHEMVRRAGKKYKFRGEIGEATSDLIRIKRNGRIDLLVDGSWSETSKQASAYPDDAWTELRELHLTFRVRRFLLDDLDRPVVVPRQTAWGQRLKGTRLWRWLVPPLQGGASRWLHTGDALDRCRASYVYELRGASPKDLLEIKEQILDSYQHNLDRIARAEQRANVFLGATVLTSSLVLGNAGLLLGTSSLAAPYLQIAAAVLGLASACAIAAAFRALQTTMYTFSRSSPTEVRDVFARRQLKKGHLVRDYIGAAFVASNRTATIADWKVDQLKAARRWILATTCGVVALTIVVLVDAVWA